MSLLTALLLGFLAAAGAVLLPGMLNLSVVKRSLHCGKRPACLFAFGIVSIFIVQAAIAIIGTEFLRTNPSVIHWLKRLAIPVLFGLAANFLYQGYRKHYTDDDEDDESNAQQGQNHYTRGLSLAILNTLAIPYFFVLGGYFLNEGYLQDSLSARVVFILGAATGAYTIFFGYASMARWIHQRVAVLARYMNFFVGGILGLLAIVQTARVVF